MLQELSFILMLWAGLIQVHIEDCTVWEGHA